MSAEYYYNIPQQQEDFKVFRNVLESKEGTLDLHLSSDSINLYLNKLGDDLSEEKTILEQFKLYSEMVVRLQCGHTQVLADKTILAEWLNEKKDLPIDRSEEHTSELQSHHDLVCRLLLEKKN